MSYTPPTLPLDVSWEGTEAYTPPALPLDVSWEESAAAEVTITATTTGPLGASTAQARSAVVARATSSGPLGISTAQILVDAPAVKIRALTTGPLGTSAARAQTVAQARATSRGPLGISAAQLAAVVIASAQSRGPLGTASAAALHLRYEIRGAVRQQGVALVRRVHCHRLADGALLGAVDTVAGRYRAPAGLVEGELCYLIPLDMGEGATDYRPVGANRVPAVLADDLAEIPV